MTLSEFLRTHDKHPDWLAEQIGGVSGSGVRKWLSGERQPDADMVERIVRLTGGTVTAADMHAVRLAWLKANRPEKFSEIAEAAE